MAAVAVAVAVGWLAVDATRSNEEDRALLFILSLSLSLSRWAGWLPQNCLSSASSLLSYVVYALYARTHDSVLPAPADILWTACSRPNARVPRTLTAQLRPAPRPTAAATASPVRRVPRAAPQSHSAPTATPATVSSSSEQQSLLCCTIGSVEVPPHTLLPCDCKQRRLEAVHTKTVHPHRTVSSPTPRRRRRSCSCGCCPCCGPCCGAFRTSCSCSRSSRVKLHDDIAGHRVKLTRSIARHNGSKHLCDANCRAARVASKP